MHALSFFVAQLTNREEGFRDIVLCGDRLKVAKREVKLETVANVLKHKRLLRSARQKEKKRTNDIEPHGRDRLGR